VGKKSPVIIFAPVQLFLYGEISLISKENSGMHFGSPLCGGAKDATNDH
jgi:hypothetical protein